MNEKEIFNYLAKRGYYFKWGGLVSPERICVLCKKNSPIYLKIKQCYPYDRILSFLQIMYFYDSKEKVISFQKRIQFKWYYIRKALIFFGCDCKFHTSRKGNPLIIEPKNSEYILIITPMIFESNADEWVMDSKEGFKNITGCKCPMIIENSIRKENTYLETNSNKITDLRKT